MEIVIAFSLLLYLLVVRLALKKLHSLKQPIFLTIAIAYLGGIITGGFALVYAATSHISQGNNLLIGFFYSKLLAIEPYYFTVVVIIGTIISLRSEK